MNTRLVINLSAEERMALLQLAQQEFRSPRDQLRVILRQALFDHGLLVDAQFPDCKEIAAPGDLGEESGSAVKDMPSLSEDTQ